MPNKRTLNPLDRKSPSQVADYLQSNLVAYRGILAGAGREGLSVEDIKQLFRETFGQRLAPNDYWINDSLKQLVGMKDVSVVEADGEEVKLCRLTPRGVLTAQGEEKAFATMLTRVEKQLDRFDRKQASIGSGGTSGPA